MWKKLYICGKKKQKQNLDPGCDKKKHKTSYLAHTLFYITKKERKELQIDNLYKYNTV